MNFVFDIDCPMFIYAQGFINNFYRPSDSAEQKISVLCSENGLVNTLQLLISQFPEAASKTELFPLGQVIYYMLNFLFFQVLSQIVLFLIPRNIPL